MFPENKNYTLGSGELLFAPFLPGTKIVEAGAEYFGNTPEFSINSEREMLDHYDADHGFRTKDDSALLQLNRSGSFTTDHISPANLAKWLLGETSVIAQASATDTPETFTAVKKGRRYQVGATPSNPSGVRGLSALTAVKVDTPSNVTLVAGTDFRVDLDTGGVYILPGSAIVDDGDDVIVTYSAPLLDYHQVRSGSEAQLEGQLLFISYNAKGTKFDYLFPYVQLAPDGDFALKGDEWQSLSFGVEILTLNDQTPAVLTNGRAGIYTE
jgi:hypothetical protein